VGSAPTPQKPNIPAQRPERQDGVAPEDIILGGADNLGDKSVTGKRALIKPSGFTSLNLGG